MLLYGSQQLEDNCILEKYQIGLQSTLHLRLSHEQAQVRNHAVIKAYKTGAEYSLECLNIDMTVEQLKNQIAKLTRLNQNEVAIVRINGSLVKEHMASKQLMHFIDADKSTSGGVEVIYGILTNFRDIVNRFYSNGLMSEKLLELVEAESVDDLRDSQPAGASIALLSKENTPDSVLLTLIAIKILQVFFVDY